MREDRPRIGTHGYPKEVWQVYTVRAGEQLTVHGFYDREKALAFAHKEPDRHLKTYPLPIEDA
jgi:hypothetical protein